jgi:dihydropyrimidinase
MYDLVIKNGRVVVPHGIMETDVGISGGIIQSIGFLNSPEAHEIIDASDNFVLPGLIDPHVHLNDFDPPTNSKAPDNYFDGTYAAAFGGNTTVIDFLYPSQNETVFEAYRYRRRIAGKQVAIDYCLHIYINEFDEEAISTIKRLSDIGANTIKIVMNNPIWDDDYSLLKIMEEASIQNVIVLVHAENYSLLEGYKKSLIEQSRLSVKDFPESHPPISEIEAVQRAILFAEKTGVKLYIVHLSCGLSVDSIAEAQKRGADIICETTPHALVLSDKVYSKPDGAKFVCGPPIRSEVDREMLWEGIKKGVITTIGSDHCGFTKNQKMKGSNDFRMIPKGLAGIETRNSIIFSEGVNKGRISVSQYVELMSTNPAKIFGLYPRKGVIAPGAVADICIFDPNFEWGIDSSALHFDWEYSPFENMNITGKPVMTILKGKVIVKNDRFLGSKGGGEYISTI